MHLVGIVPFSRYALPEIQDSSAVDFHEDRENQDCDGGDTYLRKLFSFSGFT